MGRNVEELVALTSNKDDAALSRAIESAAVAKRLNKIVGTFWTMWERPIFSATAEFEVVTDHKRRAAKYMEIMVQRTLRILLKQAIEGIGFYPYPSIDRDNYWRKVHLVREALERSGRILHLYAQARSVADFNQAIKERERLIVEFQGMIRQTIAIPSRR
jgi:hypothetical protein